MVQDKDLPTWEELATQEALSEAKRLHRLLRPDSPGVRELFHDILLDIDCWQRGTHWQDLRAGRTLWPVGSESWWRMHEFFARGEWQGRQFEPEHATLDELIDGLLVGPPSSEWMREYVRDRVHRKDRGAPPGQRKRQDHWEKADWVDRWLGAALDVKFLAEDLRRFRVPRRPADRVPRLDGWDKFEFPPTTKVPEVLRDGGDGWKQMRDGWTVSPAKAYAWRVVADYHCISPHTLRTDYVPRALRAREDLSGRLHIPPNG